MITKTTRINEFLHRWSDDGQPRGAHIVEREEIRDGETVIASRFLDPRPVALSDAPALAEIAASINASALAECVALTAQVATLTTERDTAVSDLTARTAERDALQAQIDAAAASAAQTVPAHHLRRALTQFGMREVVEAHIASLPADDPMRDDWQYAPYFNRNAVGIEAARVALGLTVEQADSLFAAAATVQT